jgi:flotillin
MLPIALFVFLFLLLSSFLISRYKRCPSDKILVVYGKTGSGSAKCYAGGAAFVWPVIQGYEFLDLTPLSIDVDLRSALSRQNIRVNVPSRFTVGISTQEGDMVNAAERLLGKNQIEIKDLAKDIIFGQLRLVVATMDIEEINADRDKFLSNVTNNVGSELKKIGLKLINVNVTDIQDESGYIEALGKKAAAEAINAAKIQVAEEVRKGDIGSSKADAERRREVAEANSQAEVGEKNAEAEAVKGKNLADVEIARSDAERRKSVAEANRDAEIAEKTAQAIAAKEAYLAQKLAEEARKERELAASRAEEVVQQEIEKEKTIIAAEAEAEKAIRIARGEANAILANYEAEAEGVRKALKAQAEGFTEMVQAAGGNPQAAIGLLLIEKLPELAKIQTEAIKDLKFDQITVFDGGSGDSTSNFLNNLYKSVPALSEFLKQSGMDLPEFLAKTNLGSDTISSTEEE